MTITKTFLRSALSSALLLSAATVATLCTVERAVVERGYRRNHVLRGRRVERTVCRRHQGRQERLRHHHECL